MIKIKKLSLSLIVLIMLFSFACCNAEQKYTEVDFQNKTPVQIMYRQNLYNCEISYNENILNISFKNNQSAIDGLSLSVDSKLCKISYNNMEKTFNTSQMEKTNIGVVLYEFFSANANPLKLTSIDSEGFYIKQSYENAFVTLREHINENNKSYYIEIT